MTDIRMAADRWARTWTEAWEALDVEPIVALYSESLGDAGTGADTYVGMVRTNADRIAEVWDAEVLR